MELKKHHHKPSMPSKTEMKCQVCNSTFYGKRNERYCSVPCRKIGYKRSGDHFKERNPDKKKEYNQNRVAKNPNVWKDKNRKDRLEIIALLGGKCLACNVTNPVHLHLDFHPTNIELQGFRHPRHKRWVIEHLSEFRLLCANHHYELSITGKIEGTNITQIFAHRLKKNI